MAARYECGGRRHGVQVANDLAVRGRGRQELLRQRVRPAPFDEEEEKAQVKGRRWNPVTTRSPKRGRRVFTCRRVRRW